MLPDQRLILRSGDTTEAPQRTLLTLAALLDWFRTAFSAMADAEPEDAASAPLLREQLLSALRLRAGSAELLVALFVALVRAQGLPARYVRLMDAMPIEPWRKRAAAGAMRALMSPEEARAKEAVHARKKRQKQQQQQDDADKGQDDGVAADVTGSVEAKGSLSSNPTEKKRARLEGACGGKSSEAATESQADPTSAAGTSRNRGEDEFERQMQLAMMATAAEAEARLTKAAVSAPRKGAASGGAVLWVFLPLGCCQCPVNNPQSIGVILNTADLSLYTARPSQEQALWRRQKLSCLEGAGGQAAALQRPPLPLPCRGLRRAPAPALLPLLGPRYRVPGTVARGYRISQPEVVMSSRGEEVCVVTMPQSFPLRVWVALYF